MKIAVTGSSGFIGSELVRVLSRMKNVKDVLTVPMKSSTLPSTRPDFIVHLGALGSTSESLSQPELYFESNVQGTVRVLEWSQKHGGVPIIFASTVKVASGVDGRITPYGLSKRVCEDYIRMYADLYSVPYVINRMSTVYGPTQRPDPKMGWFTWMVYAAMMNKHIAVEGDGKQSRDVLYVRDVVGLFVDQLEFFDLYANQTFDVGGGPENEVSINELLAELGCTEAAYTEELVGNLRRVVTDNSAVTAVHGWKPKISWREGLEILRNTL